MDVYMKKALNARRSMIFRCNPKNAEHKSCKNHAGIGITVCDRWLNSAEDFLSDVGLPPTLDHSLDRYPNPFGNYEPGNVRWATRIEQANNLRNNFLITYNGESKTAAEWSRILGIKENTILSRLSRGATHEEALLKPLREYGIEFNGDKKTLGQWAETYGLKRQTLQFRLKMGWSMEDALNTPSEPSKKNGITYNGMTKSIGEWAKYTGIERRTIGYRLKQGWSIEDALTKPLGKMSKRYV